MAREEYAASVSAPVAPVRLPGYEDVNHAGRLLQELTRYTMLELYSAVPAAPKSLTCWKRPSARSHHVFVDGTLKEPTILKWASSHQHRRWPQHGGGVLFWGRSANGLTAPGSPFSAVGEWGLTPPKIGPILRTAFRSRFPG